MDEGKFSFPLIHALKSHPEDRELRKILQRAHESGGLDVPAKQCVLHHFHQSGSMQYTQRILQGLMEEIKHRISQVEKEAGSSNWVLRLLVHRLEV